jgi:hypothetical protein
MTLKWRLLAGLAIAVLATTVVAHRLRPRPRLMLHVPSPATVLIEPPAAHASVLTAAAPAPWVGAPPALAAAPPVERGEVVLQGVVVDLRGAPVAAARVRLLDATGDDHGGTLSDEDGRFRLRATEAPYELLVFASARGRSGLAGPVDSGLAQRLRVVVGGGGRIRGVVVDEHGMPVAGAIVDAWPSRLTESPAEGSLAPRTHSDAEGRFTIALPLPDAFTLHVARAGWITFERPAVQVLEGERTVTISMSPESSAPAAAAGAEAEPIGYLPALALYYGEDGPVVLTASDATPLAPGDLLIAVDGQPIAQGAEDRLPGALGSTVELEFLRPATGARLRVLLPRTEVHDDCGC